MTVFEAYITNLGKYAEGQLVGETLKFPATTEEVQSLLKNIGVDGVRYEEFFITAFDGDVMGLYDYLTEYENLDELNHLAHLISELDSDEIETLEAVLNKGDHTSSVADIINLVHNLDCYSLHPGVTDDETLGRIYVEDMELLDVPDNVLPYFDFEAYGRDMRINEGGHFAPTGYLTRSGDFKEVYHGIEDIPAEHRIFAYMQFFASAITTLQTLVIALGAGLGVWGVVNLLEGYGSDNPGAKSQGMKQLMAGGGIIVLGTTLIPLLSTLF